MSTTALAKLLDLLKSTLSTSDMTWLIEEMKGYLNGSEENLKPYTMEEINAMIDESEAEIAAGLGTPHEDVMREWDEEIARMEQEELEMAEVV